MTSRGDAFQCPEIFRKKYIKTNYGKFLDSSKKKKKKKHAYELHSMSYVRQHL